jgi:UDP-N-acetylmuramoyl-L-alanyl-D-glutamate--2,6-diaminopimelate ligase
MTTTSLAAIRERIFGAGIPVQVDDGRGIEIRSVCYDHRSIEAPVMTSDGRLVSGDLFCCIPGANRDGHHFASEARALGAVAFLAEHDLASAAAERAQVLVAPGRVREAMALTACVVAGDPANDLSTFGVTGTNGKTTTTELLRAILERAGFVAAAIGTLSGTRTTAEAPDLQASLASLRRQSRKEGQPGAVALEVTSHGLVQHRVDGYVHDMAVFTNLSQDHLDFHKTMEAYFQAKRTLFRPEHARAGVVNLDDPYGQRLMSEAAIPVTGFSPSEAEVVRLSVDGTALRLRGHEIHLQLVGRFNVDNAVAAAAAARSFGIDDATIAAGLTLARAVPGRLERVPNALGKMVFVDYAHTPAGLAQACDTLVEVLAGGGRLVVVFGAGGDRDRKKRPLMGHHATALANVVIVTSDNPRHEAPEVIISEVVAGCDGPAELHIEADRRRAIRLALTVASESDCVLVAGKGHETTQQIGDDVFLFDDRVVVAEEAELLAGAA